ncbi:glycosyltransferase [Sinobaca sp. H24]|uniref:glycosyltransferase family 2 protein n=1 Tax=Sinobaca sp. H24 TaxID=2923376 RepID=UPI0020799ABA|nr:glycosyltransferase [Sinobaca sp. H24]
MTGVLNFIFFMLVLGFICYTFLVLIWYIVTAVTAMRAMKKAEGIHETEPYEDRLQSDDIPPVSILVPGYNEEVSVEGTVKSLLGLRYQAFEIIIVNDGSTDNMLNTAIEAFRMKKIEQVVRRYVSSKPVKAVYQSEIHRNVYLIDKENGGKADALNAGINASNYPYVCSIDADSVLERDALIKAVQPIIDGNGEVIAVGGSIRIANSSSIERGEIMNVTVSRRPVVIMQVIEYFRAFLIGRLGMSHFNILLIVSGAFGLFEKSAVIAAGGYRTDTVGEDMELVVRMHRTARENNRKSKISYIPDPVCWTEAPETAAVLRKQRRRWHQGLTETFWIHKSMFFRKKYGTVGWIGMPVFFLIEWCGPVFELLGYGLLLWALLFGEVNALFAIILFLLMIMMGSLLSVTSVLLEEQGNGRHTNVKDLDRLFWYAWTESFWYRPLTVFWRVEGIWKAIRRSKDWSKAERKGISS